MSIRGKLLRIIGILGIIAVLAGGVYVLADRALSLPFRATNDLLHTKNAPVTLDLLIPAGVHIDQEMTIRQVISHRIEKPKGYLTRLVEKISRLLPVQYRILTTVLIYLFWAFLFLVFFRIFTWMRYGTALTVALVCGAVVYYFMPDTMLGRLDDWAALFGSGALFILVRFGFRRRKRQPAAPKAP